MRRAISLLSETGERTSKFRSSHHAEPGFPSTERGINWEQTFWVFICMMTVGKDTNIFKLLLCTAQTQAHLWGLWLTHTWESAEGTSLSCYQGLHYNCLGRGFPSASSVPWGNSFNVGMCLAVLWEYVWLLVPDFCQCVSEEDLCIAGGTGKVEPAFWPLERGGGSQLGKIHVTGEVGMQWERICSCAGEWMVEGKHFSNLLHALARRRPLLSQPVLAR